MSKTPGDILIVTILNWDAYNARKDVKAPSWFRLSHSLFEDVQFYDFTHAEILAWIYLLCLASKKSRAQILVNFRHAETVARIKRRDVQSAIDKLVRNQILRVDVTSTIRARDVDDTDAGATLHNKTLQNITKYIDHFDFEKVYEGYPRKVGKSKGLERCAAQIKTPEAYRDLVTAVERYTAHCKAKGTEEKFIKHFSSFMSEWRDWIDPTTGTSASFGTQGGIDWDAFKKEVGA